MIDSLVVATDGSESGERATTVALDLAGRFDATVHALSVVDTTEDDGTTESGENTGEETGSGSKGGIESGGTEGENGDEGSRAVRRRRAEEAVAAVSEQAGREVRTAVREGAPAEVIRAYAAEFSIDLVATGTRGRHGAHRYLLGSVAEDVVRTCPVPVLTVRQLDGTDPDPETGTET